VQLNSHDIRVWCKKGVALGKLKRNGEALSCFDRALEIDPHFPGALFGKGSMLVNLGRFPEALRCFEKARSLGHPAAGEQIATCRRMLETAGQ
jgi:tetratricopeptide (TPR) repeat protein